MSPDELLNYLKYKLPEIDIRVNKSEEFAGYYVLFFIDDLFIKEAISDILFYQDKELRDWAEGAIHNVTKQFNLKKYRTPLWKVMHNGN